jgi:hypothetical protein
MISGQAVLPHLSDLLTFSVEGDVLRPLTDRPSAEAATRMGVSLGSPHNFLVRNRIVGIAMRMVAVGIVLLSFTLAASGNQFYVLQGIDKTQPDDVLTSPGVDGFTIRVSWNKLHQDGFNWLDNQIARGAELDTNIQLRVMAGAFAPSNLAGVSYFDYLSTDQDGLIVQRRAPVPWDSTMQQRWQELASQLGTRYGNNHRIKVVHIPSFANSSELHMPAEVTLLPDYSSQALAASWAAMAEPLASAFPQAIVSLNYATPTQARIDGDDADWLLEEIAGLANRRAGYQANDFAADISLERNKYQTLLEQKDLGRHIGFQMVSSSDTERFGGDFLHAVALSSQAGAEWLEIYAADVENIPPNGDYNFDGSVDAADYVVWRKGIGGDFSPDDYAVWKQHFGEAVAGSLNTVTSDAIPEPSNVSLILGAVSSIIGAHLAQWRRPRVVNG